MHGLFLFGRVGLILGGGADVGEVGGLKFEMGQALFCWGGKGKVRFWGEEEAPNPVPPLAKILMPVGVCGCFKYLESNGYRHMSLGD